MDVDTIYEQMLTIIKNDLVNWLVGLPDIASKYDCEIVEEGSAEVEQHLAVTFGRRGIATVRIKGDTVHIFLMELVIPDYDYRDGEYPEYDEKECSKYRLADPNCFVKVANRITGIMTDDMRAIVEAREAAERRKLEEEYERDREIDPDLWEDDDDEEEEEEDY